MKDILNKAILSAQQSEVSFCKFLSPNDTKATKAHQSGYLISVTAWSLFLDKAPAEHIIKHEAKIKWQDDFETPAIFTYYDSKGELRLTGFGRNFPYREENNVGDLFVLCKKSVEYYEAYIISLDEEIDTFFAEMNISSTDTNGIIPKQFQQNAENQLLECFKVFLNSLALDFPPTSELATAARNCYNRSHNITEKIINSNPDAELIHWIESEFQLFKVIENDRYGKTIKTPFKTVEELVITANTILNRRKSRAGKSLEHHLSEIFRISQLKFSGQAKTEDNKKPDFLFPTAEAYHNLNFDENKLFSLASKTTCKDRWRQILNEADRIKTKHLFTLQQGISKNQLIEMYKHNVCLVVPKPYLKNFPDEFKNQILTLESFVNKIKASQF
jgi:type II restriction enzyme